METVNPHCERLEPLLDQISHDVVEVTTQIILCKCGQVAHTIDQKFRLREVMALFQFGKDRAGEPRAPPARDAHAEQQLRIHVDRGVHPALFTADLNRGLVDRDPPTASPS